MKYTKTKLFYSFMKRKINKTIKVFYFSFFRRNTVSETQSDTNYTITNTRENNLENFALKSIVSRSIPTNKILTCSSNDTNTQLPHLIIGFK